MPSTLDGGRYVVDIINNANYPKKRTGHKNNRGGSDHECIDRVSHVGSRSIRSLAGGSVTEGHASGHLGERGKANAVLIFSTHCDAIVLDSAAYVCDFVDCEALAHGKGHRAKYAPLGRQTLARSFSLHFQRSTWPLSPFPCLSP